MCFEDIEYVFSYLNYTLTEENMKDYYNTIKNIIESEGRAVATDFGHSLLPAFQP